MAIDEILEKVCEILPPEVSIYGRNGNCKSSYSDCSYCLPLKRDFKLCRKTTKTIAKAYSPAGV